MSFKINSLLSSGLPELKMAGEIDNWDVAGSAIFCYWKKSQPSSKVNVCPTEGQDFFWPHGCLSDNVNDRPEILNH